MDAEHVVTKIQKEVSLKLRDGDPDLHRNRNETAAMSAYLKKRGHSEEHIGQLLSTLQPKLDCMTPSTTTNLKAKPDGSESDGSNDDEEKDTSVTPLEAMGFYPYWMGRALPKAAQDRRNYLSMEPKRGIFLRVDRKRIGREVASSNILQKVLACRFRGRS